MLVPSVIGVLATVIGFTAIIFFHLKRRNTSRKYYEESTNVTTDMTGNHNHPERLNETTRYKKTQDIMLGETSPRHCTMG